MDLNDILGHQQDDIIRLRFDLEKAKEQSGAFEGCETLFDFCCRMVKLGDAQGMRAELEQAFCRIRPSFDAAPWVERLAQAVQVENAREFEEIYQRAIMAASIAGPAK